MGARIAADPGERLPEAHPAEEMGHTQLALLASLLDASDSQVPGRPAGQRDLCACRDQGPWRSACRAEASAAGPAGGTMRHMATVEHNTNDRRAARILIRLLAARGALAVAVLFVVVSPLLDEDSVASQHDQASVDLGLPMPWLHQDQSAYDPPLPTQLGPASPWEDPTSISLGTFLVDVAVVFFAVALVLGLLVAAFSRFKSARRA